MSGPADLLVVMYHYILGPETPQFTRLRGVDRDDFEQQVQFLSRNRRVISCEELLAALADGCDVPQNAALITFDDATSDHYLTAFPILKRYAVPAAFFVITHAADTGELTSTHARHLLAAALGDVPMMEKLYSQLDASLGTGLEPLLQGIPMDVAQRAYRWDEPQMARFKYAVNFVVETNVRDSAVRTLYERELGDAKSAGRAHFASWDQLSEMQSSGMHIGGHSHTHEPLALLSDEGLNQEIALCESRLTARLGERPRTFSYPYGKAEHFDTRCFSALKKNGFMAAFTNIQKAASISQLSRPEFRYQIGRIDPKDLNQACERNAA